MCDTHRNGSRWIAWHRSKKQREYVQGAVPETSGDGHVSVDGVDGDHFGGEKAQRIVWRKIDPSTVHTEPFSFPS